MAPSPYRIVPGGTTSPTPPDTSGGHGHWCSRNAFKILVPLCIFNTLYAFMGISMSGGGQLSSLYSSVTLPPIFNHTSNENWSKIVSNSINSAEESPTEGEGVKCEFPVLDPFGKDMKPFVKNRGKVNCAHRSYYFSKIVFEQERGQRVLKRVHPIKGKCCYKSLNGRPVGKCIPIPDTENSTEIPAIKELEFIQVQCSGHQMYRDAFAFVDFDQVKDKKKVKVEKPTNSTTTSDNSDKLSVVVLGLDNTSRMHFLRTLQKSNEFLLKNLSAVVMKGYTKVADNSLPNVIPVLAGKTLKAFQKKCAPHTSSQLDKCPFIWKDFAAKGYKTGFAEDAIGIAIFSLNWNRPFNKPPTDFYIRPFSKFMESHLSHGEDKLCYGTRLSFKVLLDNIENTAAASALHNRHPYFHFTWTTKLSHDDFSLLKLGDEHLLNFLQYMDTAGHLNHTALIILGDHGNRAPPGVQLNPQGKVEVRMPLLYIVLPNWFKEKYPHAYRNLQDNSDKITSPFDVHATLKDFMNLGNLENVSKVEMKPKEDFGKIETRPISLFQKIPQNRTCLEAGVSLHWCVCQGARDEREADKKSADVKEAVQLSVDFMNKELKPVRDQCAKLRVNDIVAAYHLHYATTQYSPGAKALRVYFKTRPGMGFFSATVVQHVSGGNWTLTDQVIRIDHYGGQSGCVVQEYKFYCYCD